jgi:hypothetical protein
MIEHDLALAAARQPGCGGDRRVAAGVGCRGARDSIASSRGRDAGDAGRIDPLGKMRGTNMDNAQHSRLYQISNGYCFEAPGVYLWDEDRGEVERAARELARGVPPARPTRRMLIIPPQQVAPARS